MTPEERNRQIGYTLELLRTVSSSLTELAKAFHRTGNRDLTNELDRHVAALTAAYVSVQAVLKEEKS